MSEPAVTLWDTNGLFQSLLEKFPEYVRRARVLHAAKPDVPLGVPIAYLGFTGVPKADWGLNQVNFVLQRIDEGLSDEELAHYEDAREAVRAFSCLAIGVMLARYSLDELDDRQFMLGDLHLVTFVATKTTPIEQAFRTAMAVDLPKKVN